MDVVPDVVSDVVVLTVLRLLVCRNGYVSASVGSLARWLGLKGISNLRVTVAGNVVRNMT